MLISEFEGLNQPQSLVHITADREIIDSDLAEDTLAVNDEEASECYATLLLVDLIGLEKRYTSLEDFIHVCKGKIYIRGNVGIKLTSVLYAGAPLAWAQGCRKCQLR